MSAALPEPCGAIDAAAVVRGVCRLLRRHDIFALAEAPLRNGRRADLMGICPRGELVIVEIKCARADLLGDQKWPDYLDYCDRFYWAVPSGFDHGLLEREAFAPTRSGVIIADAYDAEMLRPAALHPLPAARRKTETHRLARLAMRRLTHMHDPDGMPLEVDL
jgi:hypothetical protein